MSSLTNRSDFNFPQNKGHHLKAVSEPLNELKNQTKMAIRSVEAGAILVGTKLANFSKDTGEIMSVNLQAGKYALEVITGTNYGKKNPVRKRIKNREKLDHKIHEKHTNELADYVESLFKGKSSFTEEDLKALINKTEEIKKADKLVTAKPDNIDKLNALIDYNDSLIDKYEEFVDRKLTKLESFVKNYRADMIKGVGLENYFELREFAIQAAILSATILLSHTLVGGGSHGTIFLGSKIPPMPINLHSAFVHFVEDNHKYSELAFHGAKSLARIAYDKVQEKIFEKTAHTI